MLDKHAFSPSTYSSCHSSYKNNVKANEWLGESEKRHKKLIITIMVEKVDAIN